MDKLKTLAAIDGATTLAKEFAQEAFDERTKRLSAEDASDHYRSSLAKAGTEIMNLRDHIVDNMSRSFAEYARTSVDKMIKEALYGTKSPSRH